MSDVQAIWAEFPSAEAVLHAAEELRNQRLEFIGAFTPYRIAELEGVVSTKQPVAIPLLTFGAAVLGGALAYLVIWWTAAVDYPLNVGGRPTNSLPADIPIVFETCILFAALAAFFSVLFFSGMPRLDHELEQLPGFERSSSDRYWLGVATPNASTGQELEALLMRLGALRTHGSPKRSA